MRFRIFQIILLAVVIIVTTNGDAVSLDFEHVPLGAVGTCDGPEGNVGTTCTVTLGAFTFSFLSYYHVDDGTVFPNINNSTRFLVPNRIPELIPGMPPQIHPMVVSFSAATAVEVDVFLGNSASHVRVDAHDSLGFVVDSALVLSDGTVRLQSGGNPIVALHLGIFVNSPRAAFALDNLRLGPQDTDGDGVADADDVCLNSDLSAKVVVDGRNSGVLNALFPTGCTISDLIAACAQGVRSHGQFVNCVSRMTNDLNKIEIITGRQKGAIQKCAAKAQIP
jgi:hypothetical protein